MQVLRTKAETLDWLADKGFPVPEAFYFSVRSWEENPDHILYSIGKKFSGSNLKLAVRSSAQSEDGLHQSQAGAFCSVLHVPTKNKQQLVRAIGQVEASLQQADDQILVQPMVANVAMSGVLMTKHLDDGSPYYVINYDDVSGRTDTVTGGSCVSKTVYIYNGVRDEDFDSPRLKKIVGLARSLERLYPGTPLDIEFALDQAMSIHLLQVRRICTVAHWKKNVEEQVVSRINYVAGFVHHCMTPRQGLFGKKTILGVMPDWNPAEMIGISPRPLALSLYRELITRRAWSLAREQMGYAPLPPVELMLSISGRPYIDVRASFNSFLPAGLSPEISEKLLNAWLERLDDNPSLHDKVEFEIVDTVAVPGLKKQFMGRYPGLLSEQEFDEYHASLTALTNLALQTDGSLARSLASIEQLKSLQESNGDKARPTAKMSPFDLAVAISATLEQCLLLGTLPFACIARHAFMAESLLRSMVSGGALTSERVMAFKQSIRTVSGELTSDFQRVCGKTMKRKDFLKQYGHLRPGTYDILSLAYAERDDLFQEGGAPLAHGDNSFQDFSASELGEMDRLLRSSGLDADGNSLLEYARRAIAGREYAKFIFTRHVSRIMDLLLSWGRSMKLTRNDLSMLSITEVLDSLTKPLCSDSSQYFKQLVKRNKSEHELMRSFKMAYIIRSPKDVYIVPQHRNEPNFITSKRIQAPVVFLDQNEAAADLAGRMVCIESADPGYDWIFTRGIAGLVTKYGGANSHMAIRCAEYAIPAAIGCGELLFDQIIKTKICVLDCEAKTLGGSGVLSDKGDGRQP